MSGWTEAELDAMSATDEVEIRSLQADDSTSSWRTIWMVTVGEAVYVRSVNGPGSAWFRSTRPCHEGQVRVGPVDRSVQLVDVDGPVDDEIDRAYLSKYQRYAANILDRITSSDARSTTMQLLPT